MLRLLAAVLAASVPIVGKAAPLVTISCDEPKGMTQGYGVPFWESGQARVDGKPTPERHLSAPTPDAFPNKPTFVVASGGKKLTLTWNESEADAKLREESAKAGRPSHPPPPEQEIRIVFYSPDAITAVQVTDTGGVAAYSLFPKLGVALISQQLLQSDGEHATQSGFLARCTFDWHRQAAH